MNKKVVLVTGGSRGIGRAIAKLFAESGYTVIANYNKSYNMALSLQNELKEKDINIDIFKCDVSKREEIKKMVAYIKEKYNKIDILVNNAGIAQEKLFQDITDEDWNNLINNNLYSVFCTTQEIIPTMINKKEGCIINISSVWGNRGASCESLYAITKTGINSITKSLAKELGPSNIRINSIAPGLINTDMNKNLGKDAINEIIEETPLNRIGEGIDIARCALWLAEDNFTTGQVITIDGGWQV